MGARVWVQAKFRVRVRVRVTSQAFSEHFEEPLPKKIEGV
jgi:hypothetical protein